jgi:plastocyanin
MLTRIIAIGATIALLLLAGCSSGGSRIEASAEEFAFSPTTWTVSSGDEVTLELTNNGTEEHEWVIMSAPIDSEDQFSEDLVIWEMEAAPGAVTQDTFTAPAAGTYQVICALEGHFSSGMEGELTVEG